MKPTWQADVYVALAIKIFTKKIVGKRAPKSQQTQFVLEALEQVRYDRQPPDNLIHQSESGSQYLSIKRTKRPADAGLEPGVGTDGCSYDNALAETMIGLFKANVIHRGGPRNSAGAVVWETLTWVDWFTNRRPLVPIGYVTLTEAEQCPRRHEHIR